MDSQTAKFIARVAENLPEMSPDVMQEWIEDPRALKKVLGDTLSPPSAGPELKVFKTIKLGIGLKSADDFRGALKDGGFRISNWANDVLGMHAFTAASQETEVDLVVVSVAELGFKDGATRDDIYKRAVELGLELCSVEVGPQLRLQYKDQPTGEWLLIGMEPITDSDGYLYVFDVGHGGDGLWLYGHGGRPDRLWHDGFRWVFLRRK